MPAHKPKVNLITVTKNNARGLEKTILSIVKHKSTANIKLFVIDGGSTDASLSVIRDNYDQIDYFHSSPDNGIYDAMNKGIKALPCEDDSYTIFINSDDTLLNIPEILSELRHEAAFFPTISYDHPTGLRRKFQIDPTIRIKPRWMIFPKIHHQGCFIKTSVPKKYAFRESIGIRADVALMLNVIKDSKHCYFGSLPVTEITTGGASDKYNIENLVSFFRVAEHFNQSRTLVALLNIEKIAKYLIKTTVGKQGIHLVRRAHKLVLP